MRAQDLYNILVQDQKKEFFKLTMIQKQKIVVGIQRVMEENTSLWIWVAHTLLSMFLLKIHTTMNIGTHLVKR